MIRVVSALVAAALVAAILVAACAGRPSGPNILLVTIETLRKDHVGATRNGVALTPNLDALAARGSSFDRAYAAASFTLPSLHTIATGEPPGVHGVRFWTQFGNPFTGKSIAELMQSAGYRTGFVYSAQGPLHVYPTLQRGWTETPVEFERQDADAVLTATGQWLDRHGSEPFFLWVHLFEPHTPYGPADEFVKEPADLDLYRRVGPATFKVQDWADRVPGGRGAELADALYDADVRAADAAVARLLADLTQRGLAANTVVCVVADHGENLSRDPEPRWDHGTSTDEQLIHVPLIVAGPGIPVGRDQTIARHLDLAPTLLHLAGIDPPREWLGRDLFSNVPPPQFAIAEGTTNDARDSPFYSVTDGARSLRIFTAPAPWRVELRSERDRGASPLPVDMNQPGEALRPYVAAFKAEAEYCRQRAAALNDSSKTHGAEDPEQQRVFDMGGPYIGAEKR